MQTGVQTSVLAEGHAAGAALHGESAQAPQGRGPHRQLMRVVRACLHADCAPRSVLEVRARGCVCPGRAVLLGMPHSLSAALFNQQW